MELQQTSTGGGTTCYNLFNLLGSIVVLGFNLCISFLLFFSFFLLRIILISYKLKLAINSFIQGSEKRNYDERHYCLGPGKVIFYYIVPGTTASCFALFQNLWQAQQKHSPKTLFKLHSPSLLSLPNSFMCLLSTCSCQLPSFTWPCTAVKEYLTPSFGCVSQAQSLPQRTSTIVIYYGKGFLLGINLPSVHTWHLLPLSQVHCRCRALCLVMAG